jgi:hypothetical protein
MTFDAIVDRLKTVFDVAQPQIESAVNEAQRIMVADSQYRGATTAIGTITAGVGTYDVDETTLVDLASVRINTTRYRRVSRELLDTIKDAYSGVTVSGPGGVWAPLYTSTGDVQIELWPVPDASLGGQSIVGNTSLEPTTMTYGAGATPIPPPDFHYGLLRGARAILHEEVDGREDIADRYWQMFQADVERLARRKNSRFGSGPGFARVSVA